MTTKGKQQSFRPRINPRDRDGNFPPQYCYTRRDYFWIAVLWLLTVALRYFICLAVLVGTSAVVLAQSVPTGNSTSTVFAPGEILQYKVKWGFIRIGTIVIRQSDCDSLGKSLVSMSVQSAIGLPFINVHFLNSSRKSASSLWLSEETIITGEDSSESTSYRYDSASSILYCETSIKIPPTHSLDSVRIQGLSYDALGLFMMARTNDAPRGTTIVPTMNEFRVSDTEIRFTGEFDNIDVAACSSPIRCRRVEGNAHWVGNSFAGMKGPFTGWITDNAAAVPLRAEIKIFLGSIVLELESANRDDWIPDTVTADHARATNGSAASRQGEIP